MVTIPRRYLVATIPVASLAVVYLLFLANSNFITERAMTAVTLMLTGATVLLLADVQPGAVGWLTPLLAVAAIVCATLSFTLAPTLLLTLSIATTVILWSLQLAEHSTFEPSAAGSPAGPGSAVTDAHHRAVPPPHG
jgi:hypothetical protein